MYLVKPQSDLKSGSSSYQHGFDRARKKMPTMQQYCCQELVRLQEEKFEKRGRMAADFDHRKALY